MRKLILLILLCFVCVGMMCAQGVSEEYVTSDTLQVYFRQDKILLEPQFRNNGQRLFEFSQQFHKLLYDPQNKVRSILIVSGASPEGRSDRNRYLSDNRAKVVYDYLVDRHLADPSHIEIESRGVDWKGLAARVKDSDRPDKEEILAILDLPEWIRKDGQIVDGRKSRLMNFQGGKVWNELYDLYFADLRGTRVMIAYNIRKRDLVLPPPPSAEPEIILRTDTVYLQKTDTIYIKEVDTLVVTPVVHTPDTVSPKRSKPFRMVIKSNLLYDAAVIPNIGIEVGVWEGFAVSGNYQNIWLRDKAWTRWYRLEGFEAGFKWYINKVKRPFRGHHVELYGQMLTWDFTYDGRGYLAERWAYGVGVSYGYAARIGRRLNLDFEIGAGYLSGNMHEYIPQDGHRVWQSLEKFRWIGPTKIGVTLQWLIGRGNYHEGKEAKKR